MSLQTNVLLAIKKFFDVDLLANYTWLLILNNGLPPHLNYVFL